ncbi:MAG: hypothetical protein ABIO92_05765 [Chloroflexia bacterium]
MVSIPKASHDARLSRLHEVLLGLQMRLRAQQAASLAPLSGALGMATCLLLAGVWRITGMISLGVLVLISIGFLLAALATSSLYALLRPRDLMHTARRADSLLSLDERLSTALEDEIKPSVNPTREESTLREAQLDDALEQAARISPTKDIPLKVESRRLAPMLPLLVLFLAVLFVPDLQRDPNSSAVAKQLGVEQKKIEEFKKAVAEQPRVANDPALQELIKELDSLSRDLEDSPLSREEAMARLSESENKLEKTLDPQSAAQKEALDEMTKQLANTESEAARQIGEALKSGDPEQSKESLKQAGANADKMSAQERKELAEALRGARDQAAALDPELARRLNEAADALEQGDADSAEEALAEAGEYVKNAQQAQATQEQIRQALSQLQQSKNGISQAGQQTPVALSSSMQTAIAQGTRVAGGAGGAPLSGTPVALNGTPITAGSPVSGQASRTGTPVLVQGTPGQGTPVAGQDQQGQGQGAGQGQGQGNGQGQGQGNGQGQGQGNGQGQSGQNGSSSGSPGSGWGTGHTDPVYAPPSSVNASTTAVGVQGQDNPGGEQSSTTTNTDVNNTGPAQVPYEEVYGKYKDEAGKALDSDYIPQGYKDLVRDYFTEIGP